jgi:serine/threonine protein kinase
MEPVENKSVSLDDFEIIRVLGKGEYGKVLLVQKKITQELFALKILKKKLIEEKNQVQHTLSERAILQKTKHPFIVHLHYAFHTKKKLYMVLEYCAGGELYFHLNRFKKFSESRAKFYTACIVLAINYLHSLDIIYRE